MSDDEEFEAPLIGWLEMPGEGEPYPHDANPHPADPRDASFDCPCALYPEADEAQRAQISATFAREAQESTRTYARINGRVASRGRARDHLSNLIFYMRRLSSSMGSGDDASRQRRRSSCAASWSETKQTSSKWSRPSRDLRARGFALEAAARPAVRRF